MKTTFLPALLIATLLISAGCSKDEANFDGCAKLSSGLIAMDVQDAGRGVNQLISELPSTEYTGPNLDQLAAKISGNCGITTTVTCLNCNHTDPLQTELTATNMVNGVERQTIIVITHNTSNKMVFHSIHN